MSTEMYQLTLQTDCELLSWESVTKRVLEIVVTAPGSHHSSERLPLNLALVIDRSGSMAGAKLEYVKQAACHVLDILNERDMVTIVTFDTEVQILAPTTCLSSAHREVLKRQIQSLGAGNATALHSGWVHGVHELAAHQLTQGINRCLLLTDGQANVGEQNVKVIANQAAQLNASGISTSTFGVGTGYNQFLLEAMAVQGGGRYGYIEAPQDIPRLFQEELGELVRTVGRRVALEVEAPRDCALKLLGDLPHSTQGNRLQIPIGDLYAGQQRRFYLELLTPTGQSGALLCPVAMTYQGQNGNNHTVREAFRFTYASESEAKAAPRDFSVRRRATEIRVATAEKEALQMANEGQSQEAAKHLRKVVTHYKELIPEEKYEEMFDLATQLEQDTLRVEEQFTRHERAYRARHSRA